MPARRWYEPLLVVAFAASCRHSVGSVAPGACPGSADLAAAEGITVRAGGSRPSWVLVPRDGDPIGAAAVVVATGGGSWASTALAALLESRLQKSGFPAVEARTDRDSFRLRSLVETPDRAEEFARSVRKALATPVTNGAPELGLVSRRVASLKRHPIETALAAVARCTGELGLLSTDVAPEPTSADGIAALEAARVASFGVRRVTFGVVGGATLVEGAADAWGSSETWPSGSAVDAGWPSDDEVGSVAATGRAIGPARLVVAVRGRRAAAAVESASEVGDPDGSLVARLRALPTPFRVVEATGSVRPRGGCVAVTLEPFRAAPAGALEDVSALAATIALQELQETLHSSSDEALPDRGIGYAGSKAVRSATDPREAAELAALWSFTSPAGGDDRERSSVALTLAADARAGREVEAGQEGASAAQGSTKRLAAAFDRWQKAWAAPVLESRTRVERGQGELWILVASPCGVLAEGEIDTGATALALMTALASRLRDSRGVTLEPWITPDGVGIVAHGARMAGESTSDQTARVVEVTARAMTSAPFGAVPFASARAALLDRVGDGVSSEGKALSAFGGALAPGHPAWIAPLGAWETLARAGVEGASLRWGAMVGGPLRLAVLANDGPEQADEATRTLDRWLVRTPQSRACPPVAALASAKAGTVPITFAPSSPLAQAIVGVRVPRQGTPEAVFGELLLAGLGGSDGWLAKAIQSPALAASAQARIVGGARAAALIVDVRAPEASLDAAVAQVRGLFDRLRQGAATAADLERSGDERARWDLEASLDPRRRLVDLWRDPRPTKGSVPSLDAWHAWAASALRDDNLLVVLAKPRH